jgi:transcriptional regulator with XRE-family HTH domain
MLENDLRILGNKITRLRIAKNLKQSELAYEAGISERTLQRMEAGEVVKSDGLLKVIAYLGRLEDMLEAIDTPHLSPYELANRPGKGKPSGRLIAEETRPHSPRKRVRDSAASRTKQGRALKKSPASNTTAKIIWPEDQT